MLFSNYEELLPKRLGVKSDFWSQKWCVFSRQDNIHKHLRMFFVSKLKLFYVDMCVCMTSIALPFFPK